MNAKPIYLVAALALFALGAACLSWSRMQSRHAQAQLSIATQQYDCVRETLDSLERSYRFAEYLPFGRQTLDEVVADRTGLSYCQRDYSALIPRQGDPMAGVPPGNVRAQSIVANAIFRERYPAAKDQKSRIEVLDTAIAAQLTVLRNVPDEAGVAYNYEYLVRLRGLTAGKNGPPKGGDGGDQGALGHLGGEPQAADPTDFKIHIPLESRELQDQKEGREAGKTAPRERKG